jgi:hypothetical protein
MIALVRPRACEANTRKSPMTIELSNADDRDLCVLIDTAIEAVGNRQMSLIEARSAIAHVVAAACRGKAGEPEFRGWLRPETLRGYAERMCRDTYCPCCGRQPCILVALGIG